MLVDLLDNQTIGPPTTGNGAGRVVCTGGGLTVMTKRAAGGRRDS